MDAVDAVELLAPGERARVEIAADLCKGCALCVRFCPPGVIAMESRLNRNGYHPASYSGAGCTGCAICFYVCPEPGAVTVHRRVDPRGVTR